MSGWEHSEAYWEALRSPEHWDAERARELAARRRARLATAAFALPGVVLQGYCWIGVTQDGGDESLRLVTAIGAGAVGWFLLACAFQLLEGGGARSEVRPPRPDLRTEIERARRALAVKREEATAALGRQVGSWIESSGTDVVLSQPETTNRLGGSLTDLKSEIRALARRSDELVAREVSDDAMWDLDDRASGGNAPWLRRLDGIAGELRSLLARYGYRDPGLVFKDLSSVDGYFDHARRLRSLEALESRLNAARAWTNA